MSSYRYFIYDQGSYLLKTKKTAPVILGVFFILFGILFLTLIFKSPIGAVLGGSAFLLFGFFCIAATFTKIIFNSTTQTIERKGVLGYLNKHYHFDDFIGIETVRMYVSFIYIKTAVNLRFKKTESPGKTVVLPVAPVRTRKQLELFIHEFYEITGLHENGNQLKVQNTRIV